MNLEIKNSRCNSKKSVVPITDKDNKYLQSPQTHKTHLVEVLWPNDQPCIIMVVEVQKIKLPGRKMYPEFHAAINAQFGPGPGRLHLFHPAMDHVAGAQHAGFGRAQ